MAKAAPRSARIFVARNDSLLGGHGLRTRSDLVESRLMIVMKYLDVTPGSRRVFRRWSLKPQIVTMTLTLLLSCDVLGNQDVTSRSDIPEWIAC
jgi:hypothetical protein